MDGLRAWMEQKDWNVPSTGGDFGDHHQFCDCSMQSFVSLSPSSRASLISGKSIRNCSGPGLAHPLGNRSALQEGAPQMRKSARFSAFGTPPGMLAMLAGG